MDLLVHHLHSCIVYQKVAHQKLSDGCQEALKKKALIRGFEPENLEVCYDPIIQSGGTYALKFSAER